MTENRSGDQMHDFSRPRGNGLGNLLRTGSKEFHQVDWDHLAEKALRQLVTVMLEEDLGAEGDCTSLARARGCDGQGGGGRAPRAWWRGSKPHRSFAAVDPVAEVALPVGRRRSVSPGEIPPRVEGPARKRSRGAAGFEPHWPTVRHRHAHALRRRRGRHAAGIYDTRRRRRA